MTRQRFIDAIGLPPAEVTEQAACAGLTDLFFPERGESTREAKAVCRACPVKAECLEWALDAGEKHGIWGGLSERERRRVRRDRHVEHDAERRAPRPAPATCVHGHAYTPDNTYRTPSGGIRCRTCARLRAEARRRDADVPERQPGEHTRARQVAVSASQIAAVIELFERKATG